MRIKKDHKPFILIGAGGHAKVLMSLIKTSGFNLQGVYAPELITKNLSTWRGIKVLGFEGGLDAISPTDVSLINGVGRRIGDTSRQRIFDEFKMKGYCFPALVHPHAYVDETAKLDEGAQIMAGVIIQADSWIGKNSIINTNATVEHDCFVGEHVHIAPGAVLCGNVHLANGVFIATGACLAQGIKIGEESVVGAGSSVVRNIEPKKMVMPASIRQT